MAIDAPPSPNLRMVDDLALVRRVAERHLEALAELHDRYAPLLLGLARRIVGGAFEAEEVLHESFLAAWAQAPAYDPARSSVAAWLVLVARGRALARVRDRRPREVPAPPPAPADLAHAAAGPGSERRQQVRGALDALSDEQRQVLELAFWQGLSPGQIAARTGARLETVQGHALVALKRIRQALREPIRELM